MIKRDTIQRYSAVLTKDEMGGDVVNLTPAEIVRAHVSINSTLGEITQYGLKEEMVLHVITDIELDNYIYTRYMYSGRLFRIVRQIKQGNEYYSTLVEVNGGSANA
jgi:hypothetical protein